MNSLGLIGAAMQGGSRGYLAGKQAEYDEEAAALKQKGMEKLRQWEVDQRRITNTQDADYRNKLATEREGLKDSRTTKQREFEYYDGLSDEKKATYDSLYRKTAGSGSGASERAPMNVLDIERAQGIRDASMQKALIQASEDIGEKPGIMSRAMPGDQTEEWKNKIKTRAMELYNNDPSIIALNNFENGNSGGQAQTVTINQGSNQPQRKPEDTQPLNAGNKGTGAAKKALDGLRNQDKKAEMQEKSNETWSVMGDFVKRLAAVSVDPGDIVQSIDKAIRAGVHFVKDVPELMEKLRQMELSAAEEVRLKSLPVKEFLEEIKKADTKDLLKSRK